MRNGRRFAGAYGSTAPEICLGDEETTPDRAVSVRKHSFVVLLVLEIIPSTERNLRLQWWREFEDKDNEDDERVLTRAPAQALTHTPANGKFVLSSKKTYSDPQ
ncbi:hypothetical protein ACXR0O_12260 [Verrucomicrobiota bacterium sgz303538]